MRMANTSIWSQKKDSDVKNIAKRSGSAVLAILTLFTVVGYAQTQPSAVQIRATREGCTTPCDAVVFVHGIFGDDTTWTRNASSPGWPDFVAGDPDLTGVDILRIDYTTKYPVQASLLGASNPKGEDIAEEMYTVVQPRLKTYRKVFFIAHSLGGNFVREYLVKLKTRTPSTRSQTPHQALLAYLDLFFMGSPINGSHLAERLAAVERVSPALRLLRPIDVNDYLGLLNNLWRGMYHKMLGSVGVSFHLHVAYETQPYFGSLIVPKDNALALPEITDTRGFPRNHSSLVKPVDRNDCVYKWVKVRILQAQGKLNGLPADVPCSSQ